MNSSLLLAGLQFLDKAETSEVAHPHGIKMTGQVVTFVLDDASMKILDDTFADIAVLVAAAITDAPPARHLAAQSRQRQAAFPSEYFLVVERFDLWIDEDRVGNGRRLRVTDIAFTTKHHDLQSDPDLRRSETDAVGCAHGLEQVVNQRAQGGRPKFTDFRGNREETRITHVQNAVYRHGATSETMKRPSLPESASAFIPVTKRWPGGEIHHASGTIYIGPATEQASTRDRTVATMPLSAFSRRAMRILLIEDDAMIGDSLRTGLRQEGYGIDWVRDGEAAEQALHLNQYDALLLDIGLPGRSGIELLDAWRHHGNDLPVLVISARDAVSDRILGLDAGADDYLVKPFALEELSARLRALLRRRAGRATPRIEHGALCVDPASHEVTLAGTPIKLSGREFALLLSLLEQPGVPYSRAQLEERLYGWDEEIGSNAVEVYIHSLRRKLGADWIHNVRGVGYMVPRQP
jgi:two-component system, OmpR family, response regulator QseB